MAIKWVMWPQNGRWLDMDKQIHDIFHPRNTKKKLPLPQPVRYFEAEPFRSETPRREVRGPDGRLHNTRDYAVLYEDGAVEWWQNGRAHTDDDSPAIYVGPSTATRIKMGSGIRGHSHDLLHLYNDDKIWCVDGPIHREGAPAIENYGTSDRREYWCEGRRHHATEPAVTESRRRTWYYHGLIHREDKPAVLVDWSYGVESVCYWYGQRLAFDATLDKDFPVGEPPPMLVLHALANSSTCPDLDDARVVALLARASELMPELNCLSGSVQDSDWEQFRLTVCTFLGDPVAYRSQGCDTLPLPDGVGEEDFQMPGDAVEDRKGA